MRARGRRLHKSDHDRPWKIKGWASSASLVPCRYPGDYRSKIVADALAGRVTYSNQVTAEERLVKAYQLYYALSKMRFDAGSDNFLNVLVAQNSLFAAQLTAVSLRLAERQNLVTLYKALGGGWSERDVMPKT